MLQGAWAAFALLISPPQDVVQILFCRQFSRLCPPTGIHASLGPCDKQ